LLPTGGLHNSKIRATNSWFRNWKRKMRSYIKIHTRYARYTNVILRFKCFNKYDYGLYKYGV
jgi:hypothetical protein